MVRIGHVVMLAMAAGGCFDPALPQGLPCGPLGACPGDLRCVDQVCVAEPGVPDGPPASGPDAPIDGSAVVDSDGDGVFDASDNCAAIPNPTQDDEDLDQRGDACDVCPHLAGPQVDGDSDGVGDACDPSPTVGTDAWVDFEGFNAAVPDWSLDPGWTIASGRLLSPANVTHMGRALSPDMMADAYVVSRFTITAVDSNAGPLFRSAAVLTASDGTNEYRCIIRDTSGMTANGAVLRDNTTLQMTALGGTVLNSTTTVGLVDRGTSLDCRGQTTDSRMWSEQAADGNHPNGRPGVRVQHAVAAFDYLAVISPGP